MKIRLFLFVCMIISCFGGCSLIPQYMRPENPVPAVWPTGEAYQKTESAVLTVKAKELPWREFFTDENLKQVIEIALNNNRDLRLAALNVERSRALYGIQRAELLPTVNAVGSGTRKRVPADLSSTGRAMTSEEYAVNLGISSWEIDFFGRIRSLKDRALEEFIATDQARRSAQIMLISAVAHAYLALASDCENIELAAATLKSQEARYQLILKRYDVGLVSKLSLRQAQSQVDMARGDVARYTQIAAQDENTLNLLVGSSIPQELLPDALSSVSSFKEFSPGLSSELLLSRPDVLAAEHRLKAANANIGAARAAFFPSISLTTAVGTASADLSGLFKSGSGTWSFAPRIEVPIFDTRTWSAYEVTKVEKEITIAEYEKAIQTAFREVADALAVKGTVSQQIAAQRSLVDAVSETYRLATLRYEKGIDSYLSVLDAQRSLYAAQQGLITLNLARSANLVTLYKVLGGGA